MTHQIKPVEKSDEFSRSVDRVSISAVIITFNEERKIEDCLKSLIGVADEIVVVDSCSTDRTKEICLQYPVRFITQPFQGYIAQKNFAMKQAKFDHVLSLDADERLSSDLRESILQVKNNWGNFHGYYLHRRNYYCGQWIKHSGWYPEKKIRLWDRRLAKWGGTDPHDTVIIPKQHQGFLKGDLLHYAYMSINEHIRQVNNFAEVAARAKFLKGEKSSLLLNVIASPLFRFVKSYFFQRGFLDGYYGFVFCMASSYMTFMKYALLFEYHRRGLPETRVPIVAQSQQKESSVVEKKSAA